MGGFTAQIVGLKELDAKLTELGTTKAKRIVRKGLRAGGEVFQASVMARAPIRPVLPSGTALPPGALKLDIEVVNGTVDGLPAVIVEPGKMTSHVAGFVEYGHRLVKGGYSKVNPKTGKTRGPGKQVGDVPAHPFIRPGYETARETAVGATIMVIAQQIEEEAKR